MLRTLLPAAKIAWVFFVLWIILLLILLWIFPVPTTVNNHTLMRCDEPTSSDKDFYIAYNGDLYYFVDHESYMLSGGPDHFCHP